MTISVKVLIEPHTMEDREAVVRIVSGSPDRSTTCAEHVPTPGYIHQYYIHDNASLEIEERRKVG